MKRAIIATALAALASVSTASAATPFVETFDIPNDPRGWFAFAGQLSVSQNPVNGTLAFTGGPGFGNDFVSADANSSGGAFVGDFPTGGVAGLTFSLFLGAGSGVDRLVVDLVNFTTGDEWQFTIANPSLGLELTYAVPLDTAAGWTQIAGSNPFAFITRNTDSLGFAFRESGPGATVNGYLDNVRAAAVPEPAALWLILAGLLAWRMRLTRA